jgi:GT2 family glycosyltransferase
MKLTVSIVTHNNENVIRDALRSIEESTLRQKNECEIMVVDNASTDETAEIITSEFPRVTLIRSENTGFGAGHNKAIKKIMGKSDYHLIMNPDVYFDENLLERLVTFMNKHPDTGLTMPKIFYPDKKVQYLCKLLPTPFDSIVRRFIPGFIKSLFRRRLDAYEFRDRNYDRQMEVPHLSGCFMMIRTAVFDAVGFFDEQFFMYFEDVDLSRRIHRQYKTVYYPDIHIYHQFHRGSYKGLKPLKHHVASAIKYFNKWGWFVDNERKEINRKVRDK